MSRCRSTVASMQVNGCKINASIIISITARPRIGDTIKIEVRSFHVVVFDDDTPANLQGSLPVRTSLCCEMSSLWKAMSSHIRSMSCTLFRVTVGMIFCGGRRVVFGRVHTLLAPLSRPCLVLSFVLSALDLKVYYWQSRDNAQIRRQLSSITAHI